MEVSSAIFDVRGPIPISYMWGTRFAAYVLETFPWTAVPSFCLPEMPFHLAFTERLPATIKVVAGLSHSTFMASSSPLLS